MGLLLTLGDYQSELTYVFFIGVLSFAGISFLLLRYREELQRDVLSLETGERVVQFGVFVAGLSTLAWAFGQIGVALAVFSAGVGTALLGLHRHRKETRRVRPATSIGS